MQSKIESNNQKLSFIEEARRAQILDAAIQVLAKNGYTNTSFVRIAQHAGISASLISYHFNSKEELTGEVYRTIYAQRVQRMQEAIASAATYTDKLRLALESDLQYMGTHPQLFRALIEVLFSERDSKGLPKHMEDKESPAFTAILDILQAGQEADEFSEFNARSLALVLTGARDQFLAQLPTRPDFDLAAFTALLVEMAINTVKKK